MMNVRCQKCFDSASCGQPSASLLYSGTGEPQGEYSGADENVSGHLMEHGDKFLPTGGCSDQS